MSGEIDDKAFEAYLKRGSPVSQQYQALGSEQIPTEVERAILEQARQAVRGAAVRRVQFWRRLSVPVALAACMVLAVSVLLKSGQEATLTSAPSYQKAAEARQAQRVEPEQVGAAPSAPVAAEAAAPVAEIATDQARPDQPVADRALAPAVPNAAAPPDGSTSTNFAPSSGGNAAAERPARVLEAQRQEPFRPSPQNTPRRAAPPAPVGPAREAERRLVAPAPAPAIRRSGQNDTVSNDAASSEKATERDPEQWLRHIRELHASGRDEQANREWQAFREMFPDYAVAKDDPARSNPSPTPLTQAPGPEPQAQR